MMANSSQINCTKNPIKLNEEGPRLTGTCIMPDFDFIITF